MTTDTSERGLERHICMILAGSPCEPGVGTGGKVGERPGVYGVGWICGSADDYEPDCCVDLAQLAAFLRETQLGAADALQLDRDNPVRRKFLARLEREVGKRGVVDVLRKGIRHERHRLELFYGTPSPGNLEAAKRYKANRFSVTRQLRYSHRGTQHALDLALFINGLPVATFELKNSLTKQTVGDAVRQYERDRDPREKLFAFGRCAAHFALDEHEVQFCTHLKGAKSKFLPFNHGWNDGAGNPPNPDGLKTDYLWKEVLTRDNLTNILENYAQIVGGKSKMQLWPRYHQLDVVRKLLADVAKHGAGRRYLIQHSAGSGKSNSIAWLAHQMIGLAKGGEPVFDSIVVVTDRKILDRQIRDTIKQFAQVGATVGHAERAGDLRKFIEDGKKIIISTVQKFPFILDELHSQPSGRRFAIVIDEAHSSQGGKTSAAIHRVLTAEEKGDGEETYEDRINHLMESKKLLPNASYFAFTATPKNKTLELFGKPAPPVDGAVKHLPFHSYTMKQAIGEGFILDVLAHYTPVKSYYRLVKKVEDDPEFDAKKAQKKLRRYVEGHEHAIRLKAEIMVDHFHNKVLSHRKLGGRARAMVVTDSVQRAINYYRAICGYLEERKSRYRAIVAFSGEHDYGKERVSEASLNKFSSGQIADKIREEPYRFLICADKFQTGYDEPLLHTMYVDKVLSGVKAVQTLSRLNRAHPKKGDTFVLDFRNEADAIREAFEPYYRTTILADETDPDKLHDLQTELDGYQVYTPEQVDNLVKHFLDGLERDQLDPVLDKCVEVYRSDLDEDGQIDFKGKAKAFIRTYGFLSAVLPYTNAEWEKRSIFLDFLVPRLPAPEEDDLSKGILETIDMESYRVEKQETMKIRLPDDDGEIEPVPMSGSGGRPEPEVDTLSNILREFNDLFGNIPWRDKDRLGRWIAHDLPDRVDKNEAYRNARENSDEQNARIECDRVLEDEVTAASSDYTELYKQFMDNEPFKKWLTKAIFEVTYARHKAASRENL